MKMKFVAASLAAVGLNACVAVEPLPVADAQFVPYTVASARGRTISSVPAAVDTATIYDAVPAPRRGIAGRTR